MLAAEALLVLAAVLGWRYRRRRANASTGVVSEPSFWAHLAAPSGGPTWPAVASEIRRRPRRVALIGVGAAALVAAPAVIPLSPLLWLLLLLGLCLAALFVWNAPDRGPRREERSDSVTGRGREDAPTPAAPPGAGSRSGARTASPETVADDPTLEIDAAVVRSAVEAGEVDDTKPLVGTPGRRPRHVRVDRRSTAVVFTSAVALVVALAVLLVVGGHAPPVSDRRAARASVPTPAPASTPTTTPPVAAPATTPVTAAPPVAEPSVTINPPAPTSGPPTSSGGSPLSTLLQGLP